ncbi:hypothetical protein CSPHI_01985 [Corynebacterium sphenisci DSM 44792]|uniref:Uncharacterized protein n=1 Tax=Corynebacterium sphenisci DSM 44792 TaxID=1437874 RepID=A0A1L7CW62_9CORY|nr:hypothetical protein [Corynebacterium sphenisci]APT90050.1 hypothetical protein CSPHI_01985 [Corynebacterium sphenisci DSM 44792]
MSGEPDAARCREAMARYRATADRAESRLAGHLDRLRRGKATPAAEPMAPAGPRRGGVAGVLRGG